ncbi:MAG: outer membrane protein assembly factor BamE [Thioploca sp.]|nr:outer membrane protein assembly factor BamE [Thioploca sp.]
MIIFNRILFKFVFYIGLFVILGACVSKINQENYEKIQEGMTSEEVKAILGEPTESKSAGIGGLVSGTSTIWKADGMTIDIKFLNNKVQLKSFTENK